MKVLVEEHPQGFPKSQMQLKKSRIELRYKINYILNISLKHMYLVQCGICALLIMVFVTCHVAPSVM